MHQFILQKVSEHRYAFILYVYKIVDNLFEIIIFFVYFSLLRIAVLKLSKLSKLAIEHIFILIILGIKI